MRSCEELESVNFIGDEIRKSAVHRNQKPRNQKLMNEYAIKARTSDFRRRTWAGSGGLELEVTIRGSGTPAASALARHCEATGVSLPRKGRVHESVRGQSPVSQQVAYYFVYKLFDKFVNGANK